MYIAAFISGTSRPVLIVLPFPYFFFTQFFFIFADPSKRHIIGHKKPYDKSWKIYKVPLQNHVHISTIYTGDVKRLAAVVKIFIFIVKWD